MTLADILMALFEIAVFLFLTFLFFLPSIVTYGRNPDEFPKALTVNVLLGFVVIGWILAWYYALKDPPQPYR